MKAHERWFTGESFPTDWGFAARPLTLLLVAGVVVVTVLWRAAALRLPTPELAPLRPLGRLVPYVPRLLSIHLGIALLALAARGELLMPGLSRQELPAGAALMVLEGAVGAWLISGVQVRGAAITVMSFGPPLLMGAGPVALLENAALLGIAIFLVIVPPSSTSAYGAVSPTRESLALGLLAVRIGAAVSLISLAFSEKLTNPAMARAVIEEHPQLDVFSLVGISVPTDTFIAIAGAIELLFGLLVLSGAAPQVAVLVAAVPFNASLLLFGATELIGHLPVYGIFLTLLVYGSSAATAPLVRALPTRSTAVAPREGILTG